LTHLAERDIEALLSDSSPEPRQSLSELLRSIYNELRRLARRVLARERRNPTLQPPPWFTRRTCVLPGSAGMGSSLGRTFSDSRHE
jgi:hypothetical protein